MPGPRTVPRGQKLDLKANMGTIVRVLKYVCKRYGLRLDYSYEEGLHVFTVRRVNKS